MKYRVIMQPGGSHKKNHEDRVEINGVLHKVGDVVDEGDFRPADPNRDASLPSELSEVESLLKTKHIEPA